MAICDQFVCLPFLTQTLTLILIVLEHKNVPTLKKVIAMLTVVYLFLVTPALSVYCAIKLHRQRDSHSTRTYDIIIRRIGVDY